MINRRTICLVIPLSLNCLNPALAMPEAGGVPWRNNLDAAKVEAAQTNRLVLIHFWSRSCGPCMALDQTVFNQPHVGAALERDFVPIKVDCDASPALTHAYRIEQMPTDVVLSPEGEVIAKLPCPNTVDAYLAQLQALSRHVRLSGANPRGEAQQPSINAAYANLPTSPSRAPAMPAATAPVSGASRYGSATPAGGIAARPAVVQNAAPQAQTNPYVAQAPAPGQAQAVYAQGPGQPVATVASATQPTTPAPPANAMPRSYQASLSANQAAAPSGAQAPPGHGPNVPATASMTSGTAAAPPQGAVPWTPQLPPGAPPAGLEGYCPVTLKTLGKWTPGNPAYGAIHRGRTYLFAGPHQRDQFLADPDAYAPVFAGYDPVLLLEKRQSVPGSRRYGYEFDGRIYLFSSKETMEKFGASPEIARSYAAGVRQAMNRIDSAAGDTVRR